MLVAARSGPRKSLASLNVRSSGWSHPAPLGPARGCSGRAPHRRKERGGAARRCALPPRALLPARQAVRLLPARHAALPRRALRATLLRKETGAPGGLWALPTRGKSKSQDDKEHATRRAAARPLARIADACPRGHHCHAPVKGAPHGFATPLRSAPDPTRKDRLRRRASI